MKRIIIILLTFIHLTCYGQKSKPSFDRVIEHYLFKSTSNKLYDTPRNHAYIYSIGISFDPNGRIDTLYFSDKADNVLQEIFMLDNRKVKLFKAIDIKFEEYANKIVLLTIYHYNREDKLVDYQSNLLAQLEKIYPKIITSKPIVLHKPFILGFYSVE